MKAQIIRDKDNNFLYFYIDMSDNSLYDNELKQHRVVTKV